MHSFKTAETEKYTLSLDGYGEPLEVGGKAFTLMKLKRANYNVADGFVITTDSYRYWLRNQNLPETFGKELKEKMDWFGLRYPFITRSSATVEDSKKASFAGIFTSYTDVGSVEELIERIETIYRDAGSKRVLKYCELKGIDPKKIEMAVLVQEQLKPQYSGIVFTRNPVNGKNEVVLNYVNGVPWGLVSGREQGNTVVLTENDEKFAKLYRTSKDLEDFLGAPQDIEWASKGNKYCILQARPITTLESKKGSLSIRSEVRENAATVVGTAASLGYVKAKVQYIYDVPADEAEKAFVKGNILATSMLFPEHNRVMSKASGIVTFYASINSHAAIIARELGIPCLVGVDIRSLSRYATDFDEIILDADNGRVVVPEPRVPQIRDKSGRRLEQKMDWDKMLDKQGAAFIESLSKAVAEEDADALEKENKKAVAYIMDNARSAPDVARPLYHRLTVFYENDFTNILANKYPQEHIIERFVYVDSHPEAKREGAIV